MDASDVDRLIKRVIPICDLKKKPANFLFDPGELKGSARDSVGKIFGWLGIPEELIPYERLCIHADLGVPGKIQEDVHLGTGIPYLSMFISQELFIAPEAVKAWIAHEGAHLYLIGKGQQDMYGGARISEPASEGRRKHHQFQSSRVSGDTVMDEPEEVATHVAAMALGLGKVVLNGVCQYAAVKDGEPLGHMPPSLCAYAYDQVNRTVGVAEEAAKQGLIPEALEELLEVAGSG